jgi:hypothetical protein
MKKTISPPRWRSLALVPLLALSCNGKDTPPPAAAVRAALTSEEAINQKWAAAGGAAVLGTATTPVLNTPDGAIHYQSFSQDMSIIETARHGACLVTKRIFDKWLSLAGQTTIDGQDVFDYIGAPRADWHTDGLADEIANFDLGLVIARHCATEEDRAAGRCGDYAIYGEIYANYVHTPPHVQPLGGPVSDQLPEANNGRYQRFDEGEIHQVDGRAPVRLTNGPILTRWKAMGGASSTLGPPVDNTQEIKLGSSLVGYASLFKHGALYQRFGHTTAELIKRADFLAEYKRFGGPTGFLGFPLGDEGELNTKRFADFTGGVMVYESADVPAGGLHTFRTVDFHLTDAQAFSGSDDDDPGDPGGSPDLYFNLSGTGTLHGDPIPGVGGVRRGANDSHGKSVLTPDESFDIGVSTFNSSLTLHVSITGMDYDSFSRDDDLGTVSEDYSLDNLWGLESLFGDFHKVDDFGATFTIRNLDVPYDAEKDPKGTIWWSFSNYLKDELSYDDFAATFEDVDANESAWLNPFNKQFFEFLYKGAAKGGVCGGMTVEGLYPQHGRTTFVEPIFQYAWHDGTVLDHEILVKQGFWLGRDEMNWAEERFLSGASNDPGATYHDSKDAQEHGEGSVISIATGLFDSHALLPYGFTSGPCRLDQNIQCSKIKVFDPNAPKDVTPDEQIIDIDEANGRYSYPPITNFAWSTERMMFMPYHILDHRPVTPTNEIFGLIDASVVLIVGSKGRDYQISDDSGHFYFAAGQTTPPDRWDQVNADPTTKMSNVTVLPLHDRPGGGQPQVYRASGAALDLHYKLGLAPSQTAGTAVEASLLGGSINASLSIPGTPQAPDTVSLHRVGLGDRAVSVAIAPSGSSKSIALTVSGAEQQRWAELTALNLAPGQSMKASPGYAGRNLVLDNGGPATSAHVRVQGGPGLTPVDLGVVQIPSGASTLDYQRPITSLATSGEMMGKNGWLVAPVTVTLTAQDLSGTGIDAIEYSRDQVTWVTYAGPFSYGDEGTTTLFYRSRDKALNVGVAKSRQFQIDRQAPSAGGTVSTSGGVKLTFTVTDPAPGSGPAGVHTRVVGPGGTPIDGFTAGASGTVTLPTTCSSVELWGEDTAGNEQTYLRKFIGDSVKPVFTFVPGPIESSHCTTAGGLNLGAPTVTDDCGVISSLTSNAPTKFPLGVTIVTWTAKDPAGNVQTATQKVTVVLDDDPSCCPAGTRVIMGDAGNNTIIGTVSNECILGLGGNDTIQGGGGFDFIAGGSGDDNITGSSSRDYIWGGSGRDVIDGAGGDDFIDGGSETDNCSGGTGTNAILRCEPASFCNASCCSNGSCTMPPPPPLGCQTAYAQSSCNAYVAGTRVSKNGHNWECTNGNCSNCATFASCAPGATGCPWGTVWTDRGACP